MITDKQIIEIEQIRDLKSINLVNLADDMVSDTDRLTLIVAYGDGQNIKYNYLDAYFPALLRKVIELYIAAPNKKDIYLIGQTNKYIRELVDLYSQSDKEQKEIPYVQDYPIVENATQRFQIRSIEGIINDLAKSLIFLDANTNGYMYSGIDGFKNRYHINYIKNNDEYHIPIAISKEGRNYKFKVSSIGNFVYDILGTINFYDRIVAVSWDDKESTLRGNITYSVDPYEEQHIIKYLNDVIAMNKKQTVLSDDSKKLIETYQNLYNITIPVLNRCSDNVFLGEHKVKNNNTVTTQNAYFYIDRDIVNIKLKTKNNLEGEDSISSFFVEIEDIDIILREIELDSKKYILEQKNYLPTRSTGEYKYFLEDKYSYKLYEIGKNDSVSSNFTVLNTIDINKPISCFEDLKEIVETEKKGVKTYGTI